MRASAKLTKLDKKYIIRCIELAERSLKNGESPFGSVVAKDGRIVSESGNRVVKDKDITKHAEMIAILAAQKKFGKKNLNKCTLYTICEPCPMCAFLLRELRFKKVVYSIESPFMGGHSKWNILEDSSLEKFKPVFSKSPIVIGGVMRNRAIEVFKRAKWGPMFEKCYNDNGKRKKQ